MTPEEGIRKLRSAERYLNFIGGEREAEWLLLKLQHILLQIHNIPHSRYYPSCTDLKKNNIEVTG